jgi:hypothetical protein
MACADAEHAVHVAEFGPFAPKRIDIHRKLRGSDRVLDEDVHFLDVFLLDELQRIEPAHLAGDARGELRCVKFGDRADAALAGAQGIPVRLGADPQRRHQTYARDDDPPSVGHWWLAGPYFLAFA